MRNIGVIGDYDSVCGFSAAGFRIFPVESAEQAGKKLKSLVDCGYGIIFITEPLLERLRDECAVYENEAIPCIVPIPACTGITGFGQAQLKDCVERAVGSDILFGEEV